MKRRAGYQSLWLSIAFCGTMVAAGRGAVEGATPIGSAFSVRQADGRWWLVGPDGREFFSAGACVVDRGLPRERFDPENPGYAAWRSFPDTNAWARATCQRLRAWKFTTVGGWGDFPSLSAVRESGLFFTPVLHMGSTAGAPWWDMWDSEVVNRMETVARDQILLRRDDPRLIGYYSDNELGWWNATLFRMTLEQPPTSGQRQRLLALLHETYHDQWEQLLADFEPEGAAGWEQLGQRGMLYLRSGADGIRVLRRFLGLVAERYYQLVHDLIRKYDRRALILGDRYQSFYYPEVVRAAAPYVDVISCNLNPSWNDGGFVRFELDTLHALTGKPVLASEFYLAARENRTGNRNKHGVYPTVRTQAERAQAVRRTLTDLVQLPYLIGADWFQYYDEPIHGRDDGEDYNFGLVDILDRPYVEVTRVFAGLNADALKRQPLTRRPDARQGVPRAPRDPLGAFEPMQALQDWDRARGFVPATSEHPLADLYVCWDRHFLYLGVYAHDIVEEAYYRDRIVPKADRMQWIVQPAGATAAVRARLGAGREPLVSDPSVRVENLSGTGLLVRNIAVMKLPAVRFGRSHFTAGETIEFACTLLTHGQADRMEWNGRFTLR